MDDIILEMEGLIDNRVIVIPFIELIVNQLCIGTERTGHAEFLKNSIAFFPRILLRVGDLEPFSSLGIHVYQFIGVHIRDINTGIEVF